MTLPFKAGLSDPQGTISAPSPLFNIRESPSSGRGIYASTTIPNGTRLLACPDVSLYVIFRAYRKEVCSWCFSYDGGKTLDVRNNAAGVVWCFAGCKEEWVNVYGADGLEALHAVNREILRSGAKEEKYLPVNASSTEAAVARAVPPRPEEIDAAWDAVEVTAKIIRSGRTSTSTGDPPKSARKAIAAAQKTEVDPDHLTYQVYCVLFAWANRDDGMGNKGSSSSATSIWTDFDGLTGSSTPYLTTAVLKHHVSAYLLLLSILPPTLLPFCTAPTLRKIISTDTFNSFGLRSLDDDGTEMFGFGCWPSASYWNHSCRPNMRKWRQGRSWMFETSREIVEGEECCISYLGGEEAVLGTEDRRKMLETAWGFTCGCDECGRGLSGKGV